MAVQASCTAIISGRGERIRTSGLHVPNVALYQTEPHPEESTSRAGVEKDFTFSMKTQKDTWPPEMGQSDPSLQPW